MLLLQALVLGLGQEQSLQGVLVASQRWWIGDTAQESWA
ncbi:hypothetical protein SynA18461_01917 [Synechococcus sp. A18-46.1]|nr:hypothetical protein SynA18461_01917 [Synechococcus sp. A18-46.1]